MLRKEHEETQLGKNIDFAAFYIRCVTFCNFGLLLGLKGLVTRNTWTTSKISRTQNYLPIRNPNSPDRYAVKTGSVFTDNPLK